MNSNMNIQQFLKKVEELFQSKTPTSEEVRLALVPNGTKNSAVPRGFAKDGIYKYKFFLKSGNEVTVKCHKEHLEAKGGANCNSARYPTLQICIMKNKLLHHVMWDPIYKKVRLIYNISISDEYTKNWTHIPVIWNSKPQSHR